MQERIDDLQAEVKRLEQRLIAANAVARAYGDGTQDLMWAVDEEIAGLQAEVDRMAGLAKHRKDEVERLRGALVCPACRALHKLHGRQPEGAA